MVLLVTNVIETFAKSDEYDKLSIAVSGKGRRNWKRHWLIKGFDQNSIIITDSHNEDQLVQMVKQAKVIVNVVGPYRLYGEAVVGAMKNGASHVDISGEPAVYFLLLIFKIQQIVGLQRALVFFNQVPTLARFL
uniref:Sacchrp_dh_NADP domain-containing protein n=1 Tax=Meloidogyne hapla TaxID=6305 RepID=A0A1I8BD59_MELHA